MPRPFSPFLYFSRHLRQTTALLLGLILSMMVIAFVGAIVTSIQDNVRANQSYLSEISLVETLSPQGLPAEKEQALLQHPAVAKVFPMRQMATQIPLVVGNTPFRIFAMSPEDIGEVSASLGLRLEKGRLPQNENEMAISSRVATAKNWSLGEEVGKQVDDRENLPGRLRIVGFLSNDPLFGFAITPKPPKYIPDYMVVPKSGKLDDLNTWLDVNLAEKNFLRVGNGPAAARQLSQDLGNLTVLLSMITAGVTLTGTVVTGLLLYVFVLQRRAEFALYLAMGHRFGRVLRHLALETGTILMSGWVVGSVLTCALLWSLRAAYFAPHGLVLRIVNPTVLLHTVLGPAVTVLFMLVPFSRLLRRFDFISTIEGRE